MKLTVRVSLMPLTWNLVTGSDIRNDSEIRTHSLRSGLRLSLSPFLQKPNRNIILLLSIAHSIYHRSCTKGITNQYGDIVIEDSLSLAEQQKTLYHEQVHQFLTPKLYFLRNIRIQVALDGYNRSYVLRYLEEALAQSVAELRTRGIKGLPDGIRFPVKNGYVTVAKMGKEAVGILLGPINVAGNTY